MEKILLKETDRAFIRDDNEDGIKYSPCQGQMNLNGWPCTLPT